MDLLLRIWDTINSNNKKILHPVTLIIQAILTILLTVFAVLWLRRRRNTQETAAPLPPGPRGVPLLGYLPFLGINLHREFSQMSETYGPIFKLWLGNKLCVVISSPLLVKQVVRENDAVFANRDAVISSLIGSFGGNDIAFAPHGPEWKKLRRILAQQMLSNNVLDAMYSLRRDEVSKSIRYVFERTGNPIEIGSLAFQTVINALMSMSCGSSLKGEMEANELKKTTAELMVLFGKPNVSDFFPCLAWLDIQGIEKETKKFTRVFEMLLDSAIERHKKARRYVGHDQERKDFLQFLLEHEDDAMSISMDQLKALLSDIIVGGTEPTATMTEWTIAELLKHPEAMKKVNEELTQVVGLTNKVEEFHLSKLTYLNAVVKETFRLHTPIPFLVPRCPSQSTIIGGYNVPKGAKIFLNVWHIHRDPTIWENSLEFRPERFLIDAADDVKLDFLGNNFNFLPFGSGRRICPGIPLAEMLLFYLIASLLHSFEWELAAGANLELSDKFGIVLKKLEPLVAIPKPRLSNLELYTL